MSEEIMNEIIEPTKEVIEEEFITRQNDFCVISKETFGDYAVRDIQTNSAWSENPYGDEYAVVPDEMVPDIVETHGFCDITLNEEGTEVVSFTARDIPEFPDEEPTPTGDELTTDDLANAILEGVNEV